MERTELEELGEFGLIEYLTKNTKTHQKSTHKGVGDDAAVLSAGEELVISTDMLLEGIHFDLSYFPLKHLGYKAITVNLSDIYAMNAEPTQVTVSIAVSNRFSVEALHQLYDGIHTACQQYNVDLVGGDTTSSKSGLVISVTAIGRGNKEKLCYRSGAKTGNLVCVSGDLGAAFVGLQLLEREKAVLNQGANVQPDLSGNDYLLERLLKPEARKDIVEALASAGIEPTAMIDVSDGLASELFHICKQSEVGVELYQNKLPIDPLTAMRCEEFSIEPTVAALNGGEDYELLFTIEAEDYKKIGAVSGVKVVGHITDKNAGLNMVVGEQLIPLQAQGWDSFKKNT